MSLETSRWDAADHLGSDAAILAYLEAAFEDGDPALIAAALNDVARVRGSASSAALTEQADIGTLVRAMKSIGLELTAKAA